MSNNEEFDEVEGSQIAVIGMSGRFPGAKGIEQFWENLCGGVESIKVFTDEELLASGVAPEALRNPKYVRANGALEDIALFDAEFFGYSPREAEVMDHQHRLFLEAAWEAMEDAGYDTENYPGTVGVFAGVKNPSTYFVYNILPNRHVLETTDHMQIIFGNSGDYVPTTVSYKLNLKGPSYLIQSACSTSLVAVHVACQNILSGECGMALAGGVSISSKQNQGYLFTEGGILSPDGHCRAFDEKSQGTVIGQGLGIVALKSLEDALRDGDQIYAVIKGSAINNDGSLKIGYTAPSVEGQSRAISEAHAMAGVDPATITYLETHGTGTVLGDPIEIAALTKAFRTRTDKKGFCAIGSVKTNLGHLDTAAGVTGFIKTVLALKHRQLPPSLHFEKPNPQIDFAGSPFFVNHRLTDWEANGSPRRAGVSSFGVGGTNAHVVLEEAPPREPSVSGKTAHLLLLSARTETALEAATANLAAHLARHGELHLADVAHTLQRGRKAFAHRRAVVCRDAAEAIESLSGASPGKSLTGYHEGSSRGLVFMFSGQGSQYVNMARDIYRDEAVFRRHVDKCAGLLAPHLGFDLREALYPPDASAEEAAAARLQQTQVAQPALFVVEYALAKTLMKWGVEPQAMIGHSIGEYVAACLAGVFTLEEALSLVAARGRLMQEMPAGAMLAVHLPEADVVALLGAELSLAAVNAPSLCVVSGAHEAVAELERKLGERGVGSRRLHTSHAFHSRMMEPVIREFVALVGRVALRAPKIAYVSNVTGNWIDASEATDPHYWGRHLRETVRFAEGVSTLVRDGERVLVEVGPGQTLGALSRMCVGQDSAHTLVSAVRAQQDGEGDAAHLLKALGKLWIAGQKINWSGLYAGERRYRVTLPTYPFERQRYWIDLPNENSNGGARRSALFKNPEVAEWFYVPSWNRTKPLDAKDAAQADALWIVFADECGLAQKLTGRLRGAGRRVLLVREGESFARADEDEFVVNPGAADDYRQLIESLPGGFAETRVVHLWNVNGQAHEHFAHEWFERAQQRGFYSLLHLARAFGDAGATEPVGLLVVTNNLQEVTGEESLCPEKATLLGGCKVIPKEFAGVFCRSVDLVLPEAGTPAEERLIGQLIAEFDARTQEFIIAYRGSHRWSQTFEQMRLDAQAGTPRRLRERGVYLITGGLGGVGLALAEGLAKDVRARLVLVGRNALPPEQEWEQWLASHGEDDATSVRIRKTLELRQLGAEVLVVAADVYDLESMRAALAEAEARFGSVHGVIHAAGVAGGGLARLKTNEEVERVFAPKVRGTLQLDRLFAGRPLDFFLLCSSVASVTGALGQIDYSAANAFLDAFAHFRTRRDATFTASINFPAWSEVGMAFDASRRPGMEELLRPELEKGMLTSEAVEACRRILSGTTPLPQVVISTQRLPSLLEWHARQALTGGEQQQPPLAPRPKLTTYARPHLKTEYVAPRNEIETIIVNYWREVIGVEQVGVSDNFFELGGHSLMAVQLLSRLRAEFNIELPLRSLFDSPTVAELALLISPDAGASPESATTATPLPAPAITRRSRTIDDLLLEMDEEAGDGVTIK
jgi:acyl transferase domain-containing protein/acyl carrier protein